MGILAKRFEVCHSSQLCDFYGTGSFVRGVAVDIETLCSAQVEVAADVSNMTRTLVLILCEPTASCCSFLFVLQRADVLSQ